MNNIPSISQYQFKVGQIVRHKRYGYRAVIYEIDPICRADQDWYHNNKTQPDRHQPWYHLLVDGASHTTYVAESNLEPDSSNDPINHPALKQIFHSFYQGKYSRYHCN